jgi:carbonic anhydrase
MNTLKSILIVVLVATVSACSKTKEPEKVETASTTPELKPLVEEVLTQEQRDALTHQEILQSFKDGNDRFMANDLTLRDHSAQVRKTAAGQFPKAVVLSCLDSRVPVEEVFDRGIGSVFVGRVAGNFVNEDLLGSMEFGCKVAGAKLIVVLGHDHCGAVKAAIDDVKLGNITAMLSKIRPAVAKVTYEGDRTSANDEFVHLVCKSNVTNTIEQIRTNSPILKEMEDKGEIAIVGAVYNMETGKVTFME